jgi:hypothetical protein
MEHRTTVEGYYVRYAVCSCGWEGPSRVFYGVAEGDAERHRVKTAPKTAEKEHSNG